MTASGLDTLPPGWRRVPFAEFLDRVDRKSTVLNDVEYSSVGVRWYGNGAFVRERRLGADIAAKEQNVIRAGDIVYNKLFAWKGSFAVADETVDGHLVSGEFPTYILDAANVDSRYLGYFLRSAEPALQAVRLSRGVAAISRLRLNPSQFLELTMPLPDITEQRRLVEILRHAEQRMSEAKRLRAEAEAEAQALVTSTVGEALGGYEVTGRLGDVLSERLRNGWSALCDNVEGGTPVLSVGAVTGFTFRPTEFKRTSEPTVPGAYYWLTPGDLLMTRANTQLLVGHVAFYEGRPSPCIYPDKMMRVRVDEVRADVHFVYYWLRTPAVRAIIEAAASGTSSSMRNITHADVLGLPFPTALDVGEQRRVVQRLEAIVQALGELRLAQRQTTGDLDAVFPSLLDRACHGELETGAGAVSALTTAAVD